MDLNVLYKRPLTEKVWTALTNKNTERCELEALLSELDKEELKFPLELEIVDCKAVLLMKLDYNITANYYNQHVISTHWVENEVVASRIDNCLYEAAEYEKLLARTDCCDEYALSLKAFACRNMGWHEESLKLCNEALDRYGHLAWAHFQRGWSLMKLKRMDEGFDDLHEVIVMADHGDEIAQYYKPFCLTYFANEEQAMEVVRQMLAADNDNKLSLAAEIFSLTGHYDEAELYFTQWIAKGLGINRTVYDDPALQPLFQHSGEALQLLRQTVDERTTRDLCKLVDAQKLHGHVYLVSGSQCLKTHSSTSNGMSRYFNVVINDKMTTFFSIGSESRTLVRACDLDSAGEHETFLYQSNSHGLLSGYDTEVTMRLGAMVLENIPVFAVVCGSYANVIGWDVLSRFSSIAIKMDSVKLKN